MRSRSRRFVLGLLVAMFVGAPVLGQVAVPVPTATAETLWEHWYTLELAGQTAGWMRETVTADATHYRSESEASFRISRGPIELEITTLSRFKETRDGEPVELRFFQDMSQQRVDTVWTFQPDTVTSIATQGGQEVRKVMPRPGEPWLTPMGVHRYLTERFEAGADEITYKMLNGENGIDPVEVRMTRVGAEEIEHEERTIPVTVWNTRTSVMPTIVATSRIAEDGHLVSDEVPLPFGRMVTRATTKAKAMATTGGRAPELMVRTFVPVRPAIQNPRETRRSRLKLIAQQGEMPALPSAGAQRVELGEDGRSAILHVDRDHPQPAAADEIGNPDFLEHSSMANGGDELIAKLAKRAVRDTSDDPMARAEALRRAVHGHISAKALDTAFATASETARTRTGDCSEHGVLLCAMMRAQGIPSRVATGLVYADSFAGERSIFGWHMWTQALIDGHWVDFDATLPVRYDAAHVLTGTTSLSEGAGMADLASMMVLLGNLEIEVLDIEHAPADR